MGERQGGYFGFLIKIEVPPTHTLIGHVADTTHIDVRFFIKIKWLKQTSTLETRFGSRGKNTSQQLKQVSMQMRLDLNLVCSKGLQLHNKPKVQKHQRRENAWTARQGRRRIHYGDAAHALCRRNLHSKTNRPCTIRPSSFTKSSGLLLQVS